MEGRLHSLAQTRFVVTGRWVPTMLIAQPLHHRSTIGDPFTQRANADCEPADPANTVTDRLNTLLRNGGDGFILRLCPNHVYLIHAPVFFANRNQEISTLDYPTGDDRAVLFVDGPVSNGEGHTTAVDGTCANCSGIRLRNVQVIVIFPSLSVENITEIRLT